VSFAKLTLYGTIVQEPKFEERNGAYFLNLRVVHNWGPRDSGKSAFFDVRTKMGQEQYNREYYLYQGAKGKKVIVTGEFRPKKERNEQGYERYSFLNVDFCRVEPTWQLPAQQVTPAQPQAPAQAPPAPPSQPVMTPPAPPQGTPPPPAPSPQPDPLYPPPPMTG